MIDEAYELVKKFQESAGQPIAEKPRMVESLRCQIRYKWMAEELEEFIEAKDVYEQTDAIMDLIYYALGTLVELGVKPDEIFILLHEYNLKKLKDLKYDENGKVLKPKEWIHPDLEIKKIIDKM